MILDQVGYRMCWNKHICRDRIEDKDIKMSLSNKMRKSDIMHKLMLELTILNKIMNNNKNNKELDSLQY
jgi:hypothetical protein